MQGAPLAVSLVLEVGDVVGPLLLSLFKQARVVVSWLLVAIIGQALGLVYRGIQHSMRGRGEQGINKGELSKEEDGLPWWWPPDPPREAPGAYAW